LLEEVEVNILVYLKTKQFDSISIKEVYEYQKGSKCLTSEQPVSHRKHVTA